ncbi:MAG TPA: TRCF domain-containing protein, partial [Enterovirga sp.]
HPEIQLGLTGRVPESYVPEPELRLSLYTRLARLRTREEAEALRDEIEDRFGPLPEAVEELITLAQLRVACVELGIERLSGGPQGLAADFRPGVLEELVQIADELDQRDNRLILHRGSPDPAERGHLAARLLEQLHDA